jgi:hypothetical protein
MGPKMIKKTTLLFFSIVIYCLQGCYYDIEQELYPSGGCNTADMSYATDIIPILQNNSCISCHGDLASLDLNGYADLKVYIDNGRLMGSINHLSGFRAMPDNSPKIDQCSIDKLQAWIDAGAPNN